MDNECPQELKYIMVHQHKNKLELVPPHDHRTNPAEKCIDTFKYDLISGLSAIDCLLAYLGVAQVPFCSCVDEQ